MIKNLALTLMVLLGLVINVYPAGDVTYDQASDIQTDTMHFNKNLSNADTNLQKVLETIDKLDTGGGSMVYPDAGIPLSTGVAWDTSITNNSTHWNTAYGWGNHASAGYLQATGDGVGLTNVIHTEADTLGTVTGRGATTSTNSAFNGGLSTTGAKNTDIFTIKTIFTQAGDYMSQNFWHEGASISEGSFRCVADTNYGGYFSFFTKENTGMGGTLSEKFRVTSSNGVLTDHIGELTTSHSIVFDNIVTITSGKNFLIGTTQWNSGDSIDGTKVANADLGDIGVSSGVWTVENAAVIGKVITGFTSGAGALAATDTLLQAIQKLDGNIGTKQAALSNSAGLYEALSDETGSASGTPLAVFNQNPTMQGVNMSGAITLNEYGIILDSAISGDGAYSGTTEAGIAGATLAFGNLVYLNNDDSRWELVDANLSDGYDKKLGICVLAAAADGNATTILLWGKVNAATAFPALTVGTPAYMSETAGNIVTTAPTTTDSATRIVGYGNTGDELFFCPDNSYYTHT